MNERLKYILKGILAFFLPPLVVGMQRGICKLWVIDFILMFLFWLPAVIMAWVILCQDFHKWKKEPKVSNESSENNPSNGSESNVEKSDSSSKLSQENSSKQSQVSNEQPKHTSDVDLVNMENGISAKSN